MTFSDYIVFADESGDHGLATIDPQFPVFALVFCVFEKKRYTDLVEPAFRALKFKWFGHDAAVLHEREIRKQTPPFDFLRSGVETRDAFMADVGAVMADAPFHAYVSVIDKVKLRARDADPENPYAVAAHLCMEGVFDHLAAREGEGRLTHVLFEGRGRQEDRELELEFRRIVAGGRRGAPSDGARVRAQGRQPGGASVDRSDRQAAGASHIAPRSAEPRGRRGAGPRRAVDGLSITKGPRESPKPLRRPGNAQSDIRYALKVLRFQDRARRRGGAAPCGGRVRVDRW